MIVYLINKIVSKLLSQILDFLLLVTHSGVLVVEQLDLGVSGIVLDSEDLFLGLVSLVVDLASLNFVLQIGVFRRVNLHGGLVSSDISTDALHLDLVVADVLVHLFNVSLSNFNLRKNLSRTFFLEHSLGLRLSHSSRVALTGTS